MLLIIVFLDFVEAILMIAINRAITRIAPTADTYVSPTVYISFRMSGW